MRRMVDRMSDLVVKAARDVARIEHMWPHDDLGPYESCLAETIIDCPCKQMAKAAIRAALDAIAEPSEAMCLAARDRPDALADNLYEGIYRAMIAALRKEIDV